MFNILNSLNDIKELNSKKGMTLTTVSGIPTIHRKNITQITRPIDKLEHIALANILGNESLIKRYNESNIESDIFQKILGFSNFHKATNIVDLSDEQISELYNLYVQIMENENKGFYYSRYISKEQSLKYAITHYNNIVNLSVYFKNFANITSDYDMSKVYDVNNDNLTLLSYNSYEHLCVGEYNTRISPTSLEKIDNIKELLSLFDKYIDIIVNSDTEFEIDVQETDINLFLTSYKFSKNKAKFLENLNFIIENINSNLLMIFSLFKSTGIMIDREFNAIVYHKDDITLDNVYKTIYNEGSAEEIVLNSLTEYDDSRKITFVKKAIMNKKKAFIRLISENIDCFKKISSNSVLYSKYFTESVNINTLNIKDLEKLVSMRDSKDVLYDIYEAAKKHNVKLTFAEFEFLMDTSSKINFKLFFKLLDLSVDERLKKCRQLPNKYYISNRYNFEEKLFNFVKNNDLISKKNELGLKNCSTLQAILYYINIDICEKFKSQFTYGKDIEFVINNQKYFENTNDLQVAKYAVCKDDDSFNYLINSLNLSESFIEKNFSNLYTFYNNGLTKVYEALNYNSEQSSRQLKNLKLLTKAELAGKLKDIKFIDEDFEKEIGMDIPDESKNEWKENRVNKGYYNVSETYDFNDIIRLGEIPTPTCQHWRSGSYSRCLLSNFDTNKKMLIAKNSQGEVIARALLRLTKGSTEYKKINKNKLGFVDIDNLENNSSTISAQPSDNKEELVLFLERIYSSYDNSQLRKIEKQFIALAKEKAKALGARLVISSNYKSVNVDEFEHSNYYIFISYSKNGYQYLDSIGGQNTESSEGAYRQGRLYIQK